MFGSTVLEMAIGLTFCYASVALIVAGLNEAIASALRLRARALLTGVKTMLNDPNFENLALAIYRHALINPLCDGRAGQQSDLKNKPSYIDAKHFAVALMDNLQAIPGDVQQLGRAIDTLQDPQLKQLLASIYRRAGGDLAVFQSGVVAWFDSAMERVSGTYKRRSQLISVALALAIAILFNIDSVHLFHTLWQHPALAAQIGVPAPTIDARTFAALWTLPVGWEAFPPAPDQRLLIQLGGWIITASSALFGAPFWFDLLQRMVQLRGTGNKPTSSLGQERNKR